MLKLFHIAWKDLQLAFRDTGAVVMMLATPFVLTFVMALAFGGIGGGSGSQSAAFNDVPFVVVNHDTGHLGQALVDSLGSPDLADLLEPNVLADDAAARSEVEAERAVAAVIIPAGFTESIIPTGDHAQDARKQSTVQVYSDPAKPVSAGVVRGIVDSMLGSFAAGSAGVEVTISQLLSHGIITNEQLGASASEIAERVSMQASESRLITVQSETGAATGGQNAGSGGFNWLAYMAPSMAIMFLMFTVTASGRTLLVEREGGTLSRMLSSPTGAPRIIGGKVVGTFLVGVVQMAVLFLASYALFGLKWGSVAGVVLLTLALVAAATGWGMLLAAYCRTPAQAGQLGAILSLVFAMTAGNLVPRAIMPEWLRTISYVTPNAWGLEGYTKLGAGGGLGDVALMVVVLLAMAAVLMGAATLLFRRQYA